jgi:hypothetical protein
MKTKIVLAVLGVFFLFTSASAQTLTASDKMSQIRGAIDHSCCIRMRAICHSFCADNGRGQSCTSQCNSRGYVCDSSGEFSWGTAEYRAKYGTTCRFNKSG